MRLAAVCRTVCFALACGFACGALRESFAVQHDGRGGDMAGIPTGGTANPNRKCDDMSGMGEMSVMGESMMAMMDHMCVTPLRTKQPGDEEKVKAIVAQVRETIAKYKDYKKALADGYLIANPKLEQP